MFIYFFLCDFGRGAGAHTHISLKHKSHNLTPCRAFANKVLKVPGTFCYTVHLNAKIAVISFSVWMPMAGRKQQRIKIVEIESGRASEGANEGARGRERESERARR